MADRADRNGPDPIDVHVGLRIRTIRRERDMSQDMLGKALGISFQQVQKYERGTNRVSTSMLVHTARALGCSAGQLLPSSDEAETTPILPGVLSAVVKVRGVEDLVQAFSRIEAEEERAEILRLATVLAKRSG